MTSRPRECAPIRVCADRSKRALVDAGDYVGAYFLDDRAAVTALLRAARLLRERGQRPPDDAYLVFTTGEEIGGVGGSYASAVDRCAGTSGCIRPEVTMAYLVPPPLTWAKPVSASTR